MLGCARVSITCMYVDLHIHIIIYTYSYTNHDSLSCAIQNMLQPVGHRLSVK